MRVVLVIGLLLCVEVCYSQEVERYGRAAPAEQDSTEAMLKLQQRQIVELRAALKALQQRVDSLEGQLKATQDRVPEPPKPQQQVLPAVIQYKDWDAAHRDAYRPQNDSSLTQLQNSKRWRDAVEAFKKRMEGKEVGCTVVVEDVSQANGSSYSASCRGDVSSFWFQSSDLAERLAKGTKVSLQWTVRDGELDRSPLIEVDGHKFGDVARPQIARPKRGRD